MPFASRRLRVFSIQSGLLFSMLVQTETASTPECRSRAKSSSRGFGVKETPSLMPLGRFCCAMRASSPPIAPAALNRMKCRRSSCISGLLSEQQADAKLDISLAATLGNLSEQRIAHIGGCAAHIELRRVEHVVEFGAELDVVALFDRSVFKERPVPGIAPGRAQVRLAQTVGRYGESRRRPECGRVEPSGLA